MIFPAPNSDDPARRFQDATDAARAALEKIIADANAAGWGSDEIAVALVEAARLLKDANVRDPDPADDPAISDTPPKQQ